MNTNQIKWWGWGVFDHSYHLKSPAHFQKFLVSHFGTTSYSPPPKFEPASVRKSGLARKHISELGKLLGDEWVSLDELVRATHSMGKSYKDLIRFRSLAFSRIVDAVVFPAGEEQVQALVGLTAQYGITLIPFGGGTTVVGGVEPPQTDEPVISVDLCRMNKLIKLDEMSGLADFETGILGPDLEKTLEAHGLTLGHFPQSFEFSTLGGWIATRSAGHKSTMYGKIEDMVRGMRVVKLDGQILEIPAYPEAAVGPDLRQLFCGSEGRYGIITQATMKVNPLPEKEILTSFVFDSFSAGMDAARAILQKGIRPAVLRLSDEKETEAMLSMDALSESRMKSGAYGLGLGLLRRVNYPLPGGALMILGVEGSTTCVGRDLDTCRRIIKKHSGKLVGKSPAKAWLKGRYETPYLRDELLNHSILVDTLETASSWSCSMNLYLAVCSAIEKTFAEQDVPGIVGCHLSHAYADGASLYFTLMARQQPGREIKQWQEVKTAATDAILAAGGVLSHHHGIGRDHAEWMPKAVGLQSYRLIGSISSHGKQCADVNPDILFQSHLSAVSGSGSFCADTRTRNLKRFADETFDLAIIGGGITGAGIARDAAMRGMKVALLEKGDFASGTSSRSAKMIHGGLRYLKHMHLKLVKESLRERGALVRLAPHLVHPVQYILPVYKGAKDKRFEIKIGLIGYDLLARSHAIGHHEMLSKNEIAKLEPSLRADNLTGGFIYYDCLVDDARLTLSTIKSAAYHGAVVANYAKVVGFELENGQIQAARFNDTITDSSGVISAKVFVNAAGPWVDRVKNLQGSSEPMLRPTKGIHIVVDYKKLPVNHVVVVSASDERMIFAVPLGKRHTYIGTTDTDYDGDFDDVCATDEDVDYLLEAVNNDFLASINRSDVLATWAGLRPLIREEGKPSEVSRDYEIEISDSGLVSIAGGKLTTYRHMAESLLDKVLAHFEDRFSSSFEPCQTADSPLYGGEIDNFKTFVRSLQQGLDNSNWHLSSDTIVRLVQAYGTDCLKILGYGMEEPALMRPICTNYGLLGAEVAYALREEMALTLKDIFCRRTQLAHIFGSTQKSTVQIIADMMAQCLGWSQKRKNREVEDYLQFISKVTDFK